MGTYTTLRAANEARQVEWDTDSQITLAYRGNEFAGEAGEVCNVIKKLERERMGIAGSRDTVEHLAEELADAVICADLIAMKEGIDLDAAIEAKFNATSEKVGLATRYRRRSAGHPRTPAAHINALIEEGTREELCEWLQKQWNEIVALRESALSAAPKPEPASTVTEGECATEGCRAPAMVHFVRGGVGSTYCHACYLKVQALSQSQPAPQPDAKASGVEGWKLWATQLEEYLRSKGDFDYPRLDEAIRDATPPTEAGVEGPTTYKPVAMPSGRVKMIPDKRYPWVRLPDHNTIVDRLKNTKVRNRVSESAGTTQRYQKNREVEPPAMTAQNNRAEVSDERDQAIKDAVWLEGLAFVRSGEEAARLLAIAERIRSALSTSHPEPVQVTEEIEAIAQTITPGNIRHMQNVGDIYGWCERLQSRIRALEAALPQSQPAPAAGDQP